MKTNLLWTLMILMLAMSACSLRSDKLVDNKRKNNPGGGGPGLTGIPKTVALVSGNQLMPALAVATGVTNYRSIASLTTSETNFRQAYSPNGDIAGFSSQVMLAVMDLATGFCEAAITQEAPLADSARKLYPGINLNAAPPAGGFSDAVLKAVIKANADRFLGANLLTAADEALVLEGVKGVYNNLPATSANTLSSKANQNGTRSVARAACDIISLSSGSLFKL